MIRDDTPVLIGVGQVTVRDEPLDALSTPMDLMIGAAIQAADDAGIQRRTLASLDAVVVVKSFREPMRNSPATLARHLGATRAETWLTPDGGQAPQALANRFAAEIAAGRKRFVLLAGAEAMENARRLIKSGCKPDWKQPADSDPNLIWPDRPMVTDHERAHGIWVATNNYALLENACRHHMGRTIEEHQLAMGQLFAGFTDVAAKSPHAWFPVQRTAEEIATPGPKNRFVSWPYTKFMNAMNQINQSAALLMTSVGEARRMGVPQDRWLFLHGCADTTELWYMHQRQNYHSSPAMHLMAERAFAMAGRGLDDIDLIDIYSCFPSAVQIGRDALGMAADDPRPLTVTGGLPYHGGAGNNYSMNAIATMADRLRAAPGRFGLVTANGGYITKHAAGIWSTEPVSSDRQWQREDPASYQSQIDSLPRPPFTETPSGEGEIETWTVLFGRDGAPSGAVIIARLGAHDDPAATRFIANAPNDLDLLLSMTKRDMVGVSGVVAAGGQDKNILALN
ncbi:MAG: acetyl-CoA acetyltransferase [Minwuia sp.]|nr:acetyl-CoA acetyltransferase [Minwuia sp.]